MGGAHALPVLFALYAVQAGAVRAPHRPVARPRARPTATLSAEPHARITLVRHGQSEWNLANRFTGWVDVDLTERGIAEARRAGQMLAENGLEHDLVCTSTLRRAVRTACLVLSTTTECWLPIVKDARLNEQHSGRLTGFNKRELADEHGVEQVMRWRRTYDSPPPAIEPDNPLQRSIRTDVRYRRLGVCVPATESLADTLARVSTFWEEVLKPELLAGRRIIVVSHGNTLRALVKLLDNVDDADSFHLDLPTACPVVYDLDRNLRPMGRQGTWGTSSVARHGRYLMSASLVAAAQQAMREQCVRDIAVSTVSTSGGEDAIATCDAWTASAASVEQVTSPDGQSFNVRSKPPSSYSQTEIVQAKAARELRGFRASASVSANSASDVMPARVRCMLIVLRHGYSEFNAANRFTGWVDVDLTNRGREEARVAGSMLRAAGITHIERVYTSMLRRSIKTAWLMLDELELQWVPISCDWRLNERHYGALQGRNKRECADQFGVRQVQTWRRSVHQRPPPWDATEAATTIDRRYDASVSVPTSESLADCTARLRPFLDTELRPAMRAAIARRAAEETAGEDVDGEVPIFVISSSENLIRGLVAELEGLHEEKVPLLDIPYATPLVYQFDEQLETVPTALAAPPLACGWYLGDAARIKDVQRDIRAEVSTTASAVAAAVAELGVVGAPRRPGEDQPSTVAVPTADAADVDSGESCFQETVDGELKWVCPDDPPP